LPDSRFSYSAPNEVRSHFTRFLYSHIYSQLLFSITDNIREHLYRYHALPTFQCYICYDSFENSRELTQHLRPASGESPCRGPREQTTVGFTPEQEIELRRRQDDIPEEERWKVVWRILFQGDQQALENIPSPCKYRATRSRTLQMLIISRRS
jgi:hypothetical protein